MHIIVAARSGAAAAAQKTNGPCSATKEVVRVQGMRDRFPERHVVCVGLVRVLRRGESVPESR